MNTMLNYLIAETLEKNLSQVEEMIKNLPKNSEKRHRLFEVQACLEDAIDNWGSYEELEDDNVQYKVE